MAFYRKASRNIAFNMEEITEEFQAKLHVKGLAAHILEEVIKADMSMHQAQIDAWKKFGEYRPQGNLINDDIHIGFAEKRYLCLNEVKLSFYIKKHPKNILNRIKLAFNVLRGKNGLILSSPTIFDLSSPDDKEALHFEVLIKRFENGAVKAEYKPIDNTTREILNLAKV